VIKADDFVPRAPAPTNAAARRVSPMGGDTEDDATPQLANMPAFITSEAPKAKGSEMPKGQYDRSKSKPRAPRHAGIAAGEQGAAAATPEKKKRKAKVAKAARVTPATPRASSAPAPGRFARWDDGSIDINVDGCTGRLNAKDAAALAAFMGPARGR
jgi:hypothetical protein